ncbi:hypothetical protein ABTZ93_36100 [Streptomyces sp. NPDC097941]|uniref:hypothetical protein n=1 Tax=Streptomyces sp. NPDC097941 TaxID=3155685 RepID=UPI00332DBB46
MLRRRDIDVPVAVRALQARDAAVNREDAEVDRFAYEVLGLWRGGRWREPVSTALLGNWAAPLETDGGSMTPAFLDAFRTEVKALHRALTPLWERRTGGHRLRSLDYSIGDDGMTVHDLVTGGPDLCEALTGALPDDPRIAAVLAKLTPAERAVAMAWANRRTDWAEAAATVIALAPPQFAGRDATVVGDGVRRKLKRLGDPARRARRRGRRVEGRPEVPLTVLLLALLLTVVTLLVDTGVMVLLLYRPSWCAPLAGALATMALMVTVAGLLVSVTRS